MSDLTTVHGCGIAIIVGIVGLYGVVYLLEAIHRGAFF